MKAYNGIEPYAFLSYSHKDADRIEPIIDKLQKIGCNIWYDEGIEPADEWAETVAKKLGAAEIFFVVISFDSINSQNVKREIYYAVSKNLPILAFYLDDVKLSEGLELQLGISQAVYSQKNNDTDCNLILSVLPNKLKTEPKEILFSGRNYIYYFKTYYDKNEYLIERQCKETGKKETVFHHKESIYGSYSCHSIHYANENEFHSFGEKVLFFDVLANIWPDDVASAPDYYYNINFAIVRPDNDNAELKIMNCKIKHVKIPFDGNENSTSIKIETIIKNSLDNI